MLPLFHWFFFFFGHKNCVTMLWMFIPLHTRKANWHLLTKLPVGNRLSENSFSPSWQAPGSWNVLYYAAESSVVLLDEVSRNVWQGWRKWCYHFAGSNATAWDRCHIQTHEVVSAEHSVGEITNPSWVKLLASAKLYWLPQNGRVDFWNSFAINTFIWWCHPWKR